MITRYEAADPLDPTSQAEYKVLAAGAQRYWHGTRAAFEQVKNSIPNNTMICITDDNDAPSDNAPIGSVFDYEGNTAPDGYLFCNGSQFDTSLYPDLYLFLGSDTLPEKYTEYGEPELLGTAPSYTFTAAYDGVAYGGVITTPSGGNIGYIAVNGIPYSSYGMYSSGSYKAGLGGLAQFKKGDTVNISISSGTNKYRQYLNQKPKIIKAISNMNKSDASALLAQMAQHIRNQNILSDYEDITISTDSANPTVMQYDGFIYVSIRYYADLYINTTSFLISDHDSIPGGGACMVAVRKGDRVYIHSNNKAITERVAYYKLRDYTGR